MLLRAVTREDVGPLHTWSQDRATWALTSDRPYVPRPLSVALREFDEGTRWASTETDVVFAVEVGGELAGSVALWGVDLLARSGNLGISLGPHARGRGVGSAASRALLAYAFRDRGLHRVALSVLADNTAAVRTYEAVGFVHEGRRRESAWVDGRWVDELAMGMLADEWHGPPGHGAESANGT